MAEKWILSGPLGEMILFSRDGNSLSGLWFRDQRFSARGIQPDTETVYLSVFADTEAWLSRFFRGIDPGPAPKLAPVGTPFQRQVWAAMREIPYGETCSYGKLASIIRCRTGSIQTSPRAVGGAVSHNPISILLPCQESWKHHYRVQV